MDVGVSDSDFNRIYILSLQIMPGGSKYRQWYAMRTRLQQEGKWRGKTPSHFVPSLEEGEPRPKEPALGPVFGTVALPTPDASPDNAIPPSQANSVPETPEHAATPESLPELEPPETEEGNELWTWVLYFSMGKI